MRPPRVFACVVLGRLVIACGLTLANFQAAAAAPPGVAEVEGLVRQLGAEARKDRLAAEQRLIDMGPEILDRLPPPDLLDGAGSREAVGRIRQQLELMAARESIRPRLAALRGTRTWEAWAGEIARETGNSLLVSPADRERLLALDLPALPFWETLRRSGWEAAYDPGTNRVSLVTSGRGEPPAADCSGIFRVTAEARRRGEQVHVALELWGEPRIRPLYARIADSAVTLERGELRSIPVSADARREIPMTGRGPVRVTVPLEFPPARFGQLEGTLQVKTAALPVPVEFNLGEGGPIARRRGGVTVTCRKAEAVAPAKSGAAPAAPPGVSVRMSIAYDHGGPEFESHRLWLYHNEAWLETRGGDRLGGVPEIAALEEMDGGLALDYFFPGLETPLKELRFVYVVPTLILDVPVSFRIPDLPILAERKADSDAPVGEKPVAEQSGSQDCFADSRDRPATDD